MKVSLPYKLDINGMQSTTFTRKIRWVKKSNGQPVVNLANFRGKMTIQMQNGPSITLNSSNGGLVFNAGTGEITINIPASTMAFLANRQPGIRTGQYDLLIYPTTGVEPVYALLTGSVTVHPGVTRV